MCDNVKTYCNVMSKNKLQRKYIFTLRATFLSFSVPVVNDVRPQPLAIAVLPS